MRSTARRLGFRRLTALGCAAALALSACGGDDDSGGGSADTEPPASTSAATTSASSDGSQAPSDSGTAPAYEEASINIAVDAFTLGAPVFVALEKGYFDEVALDVTPTTFQTGIEGIKALAGGQVDFAFGLDFAVISSVSPQLAIAGSVAQPKPGFHKLVFGSGITSPDQLAGKKVGVVTGTAEAYVTSKWLESNGLAGSVELVPVPGAFELVAGLKTGDIQAAFVWGPAVAEVEKDSNLSLVGDDSAVLDIQGIYLLTSTETATADPELVTRVLTALQKADADIASDPDGTGQIVADAVKGDAAAISATLANSGPSVGFPAALLQNLLRIQEFLVSSGAVPATTDVEASLMLDPIRAIAPDKVEV